MGVKAKQESKHTPERWDEQTLQVSIVVIKKGRWTRSDIGLLAFQALTFHKKAKKEQKRL